MLALVIQRFAPIISSYITRPLLTSYINTSAPLVRHLSFSTTHYSFPNMQRMMDEISKNPKAMALLNAIKKDPKILHAVQDLMMTMNKKGFIDLNNLAKQPNLAMLADNEVRNKMFDLIKLLASAGVFNAKDTGNPMNAFSNVMSLLMPPSLKDQKNEIKQKSSQKYDFTYDATKKDEKAQTHDTRAQDWTDKFKKIFK